MFDTLTEMTMKPFKKKTEHPRHTSADLLRDIKYKELICKSEELIKAAHEAIVADGVVSLYLIDSELSDNAIVEARSTKAHLSKLVFAFNDKRAEYISFCNENTGKFVTTADWQPPEKQVPKGEAFVRKAYIQFFKR